MSDSKHQNIENLSSNKIGFILPRSNTLRELGALIEIASHLKKVEIYLFISKDVNKGSKSYLEINQKVCERELSRSNLNNIKFIAYNEGQDLREKIIFIKNNSELKVFSTEVPQVRGIYNLSKDICKWIVIHTAQDTFTSDFSEFLPTVSEVWFNSEEWRKVAINIIKQKKWSLSKKVNVINFLKQNGKCTGFIPLLKIGEINREFILKKLNFEKKPSFITYIPAPQSVKERRPDLYNNNYYQYTSLNIFKRTYCYLKKYTYGFTAKEMFLVMINILESIDGYMILAIRRKQLKEGYWNHKRVIIVYDDQMLPSSLLEALSISSVLVHHQSMAVREAAAIGIPSLSVAFSAKEYTDDIEKQNQLREVFNLKKNWLFNFAKVSRSVKNSEGVSRFKTCLEYSLTKGSGKELNYFRNKFGLLPADEQIKKMISFIIE